MERQCKSMNLYPYWTPHPKATQSGSETKMSGSNYKLLEESIVVNLHDRGFGNEL